MHSAVVALEPSAGLANEAIPRDEIVFVAVVVGIPVATEWGGGDRPSSSDCPWGSSGWREDASIIWISAPTGPVNISALLFAEIHLALTAIPLQLMGKRRECAVAICPLSADMPRAPSVRGTSSDNRSLTR
jgi:hypothetical protein